MDLVVLVLAMVVLGALVVAGRRARRARHAGSKTVELAVTAEGVRRTMADGRSEAVRFVSLTQVEVVLTSVPTADAATGFVLLAEDLGEDPRGCLVPLGIGHDEALLAALSGLVGFDRARWSAALAGPTPSRRVVWEAPAAQPAGGEGTGSAA